MTDVDPSSQVPPDVGSGPSLSADDLARLTGGRLLARSDRPIRGGAVDSRAVRPGELFVALPGERTDGHTYLGEAVARGAAAVLVTRQLTDPASLGDVSVVRVADGLAALGAVATGWRLRFDPLVVGITGSIAKTSTKEAVAAVLSADRLTLKSEGNQNNEIGLPLTLLRIGPEHRAVVLEMGMYVSGEIADLAAMGRPQIGVVTAVQAVHLSRIGTLEAIERAKGELVEALPADGTAILNADDPLVSRMDTRTAARVVRYGFGETADVRAVDVEPAGVDGMRFTLATPRGRRSLTIPTLGRLSVHNAAAAAAVGIAAGIELDRVVLALEGGWSAPHRVQLVRLRGVTVIDDSYNASPGSMTAALDLLGDLPGRRVAVLGEMLELGPGHDAGHETVGAAAARVAELLVVVGRDAGGMAAGAIAGGLDPAAVHRVDDVDSARDILAPRLRDGDVVLVKASRGVGLDLLVEALRSELGEAAR
ncbi:MAG TPA: UDP-N-acetylmuramoyl-tripeptide--D-alanyl-D-alanine ligase [Candidatus Limnocylindrales bacterium]|nr:UDP-N-acetylmuramoyl-tripeptide--D-alanyl-D-alanine ligase [Candidatus Limnocylindrales bacterium]